MGGNRVGVVTVASWSVETCPNCQKSSSVELDSDARLCLECRHEWAPSSVTAEMFAHPVPRFAEAPTDLAAVPEPAPSGATAGPVTAARSRYLGCEVMVHEVDAIGTITEIDDAGMSTVTFGSGFYIVCAPDEFTVTDARVIEDETITALATTDMAIAAQVLRAGAATIEDHDGVRHLTLAPDGWLPDEPGVMPVVEHGAAYAIATLATTHGIATEDLLAMADLLDNAADAAKGATS